MLTPSQFLIIVVTLIALLFIFMIISNLRYAAGMRARDSRVIDKTRINNKRGRNRFIMTVGRAGKANSLFALVHHTGRKSGKLHTTPVRLVHHDNTFIIPLTYGERADWYKNLMESGMMKITWQGQTFEVGNPELLEVDEAIDDFPWISRSLFKQEGLPAFLQVSIVQ